MRSVIGWAVVVCGSAAWGCGTVQTEPRSVGSNSPAQSHGYSESSQGYADSKSAPNASRYAQPPGGARYSASADEAVAPQTEDSYSPRGRTSREPSSAPAAQGAAPPRSVPQDRSAERRDSRALSSAESESAPKGAWKSAPEPQYRPGLATRWGETRYSRVSSVPFQRDSEYSPFLTARLFYNNAEGIQAMLDRSELRVLGQSQWSAEQGNLVVRVVNGSGGSFPAYRRGSDVYVTGREGERYLIEIKNNTGSRYEAVATVDGLDVIDGQPGNFEKRGYLVGPWATVQIDGFRQSENEVASFRFGGVGESYAASKGDDRNVGVIGVAFFDEIGSRVPQEELRLRERAEPFPGQFAAPPVVY
ncbi:MAG: hypothetical protein SFV15_13430 [Polyangiaceae bacterium]|nr:hypothetical protein [Polyangiaceae bacterium]